MPDRWDPKSAVYALAIEDYEVLLAQEYDTALDVYRPDEQVTPLVAGETSLDAATVATLEKAGFRPVVRTHSVLPATIGGGTSEAEIWADGATRVEIGLAPESLVGRHFISTYFSNGTAITVWPSDAMVIGKHSARRENLGGVDDLALDIRTALDAREARFTDGVRALLFVDAETAKLSEEIRARFFQANSLRDVPQFNPSGMWKFRAALQAKLLVGVIVLTAIAFAVSRSTGVLLVGGSVSVLALLSLIQTWWRRNEPLVTLNGVTEEQIAELFGDHEGESG